MTGSTIQAGPDGAPITDTPTADVPADVQAFVDREVAAALKAAGVSAPAKTPVLDRLKELEQDGTSFADRVSQLAAEGYKAVVAAEDESPVLKTLLTVVEGLVEKA